MKKSKDDLTILADKYECDKGSLKHNYTKIYNTYFHHIRNKQFKMLEIGFGVGASVKMWLNYFNNAILCCIDIMEEFPKDREIQTFVNEDRFKFASVDQSSATQMLRTISKTAKCKFEIIIDDGSHRAEDQMYSFGFLFQYLTKGGVYVIEDLNCKRTPNKTFGVEERKVTEILKEYNKTGIFNSEILTQYQMEYVADHIEKVEIYENKIAFITKN